MLIAVLGLIFRIAMLFAGGLLIYTAFAMFPDEEGRLQNRLENLWIAVDDRQKSAVGRATLLFNRIASYVTRVYNRILGASLISIQMIGVSSASSIAAFFLFAALLLFFLLYLSLSKHAAVAPHFNSSLFLIGVVCLVFGFFSLVFALVPSFFRNWFGRVISLVPLLLFTYVMSSSILANQGASKSTQETVLFWTLFRYCHGYWGSGRRSSLSTADR